MQNKLKFMLIGVAFAATILTLFAANTTPGSNPPGSLNVTGWYSLMRKSTPPYLHDLKSTPSFQADTLKTDSIAPKMGQQLHF